MMSEARKSFFKPVFSLILQLPYNTLHAFLGTDDLTQLQPISGDFAGPSTSSSCLPCVLPTRMLISTRVTKV